MNNKKSLEEISISIERWLNKKPGNTLEKLSQLSCLADTTVRYILDGSRKPNINTVLAITDIVMSAEEKIQYLEEHYPRIGRQQRKALQTDKLPETSIMPKVREFLGKELHNRIYNMAATKAGTTEAEIKDIAGRLGLEAMGEMLKAEVLVHQNGRVKFVADAATLPTADDLKKQVEMSAKHFDTSLVGTTGSKIMHLTGSVNQECLEKLHACISEFTEKAVELKNREESFGSEHLFFCDLVFSLYNGKEESKS